MLDNLQPSMISLGQLYDEKHRVMLDKNNFYDFDNENLILQGRRSHLGNGLWDILTISQIKRNAINSSIEVAATKQTH